MAHLLDYAHLQEKLRQFDLLFFISFIMVISEKFYYGNFEKVINEEFYYSIKDKNKK